MLTRTDKIWLCKLAAMIVRIIAEVIVGEYKTQIAVDGAKRIKAFGAGTWPEEDFDDLAFRNR